MSEYSSSKRGCSSTMENFAGLLRKQLRHCRPTDNHEELFIGILDPNQNAKAIMG